MIDNTALQIEIDSNPALTGAGVGVIFQRLNAEGSALVESWRVSPQPKPVGKEDFLAALTIAEAAALQDLIDSPTTEGKALKFKLSQSNSIDMSRAGNRDFVTQLQQLTVLTATTADALLRLGEVKASRAYELWGEAVTLEQIEAVMGV